MTKRLVRRGVSKAEWLEAALEYLASGSIQSLSIEHLASKLGIAKSGFYWHFRNRDELLREMLSYWVHKITEVITTNPEFLEMEPVERLRLTAETVFDYDLARWEMAFRQWAMEDRNAAQVVRKVNRMRGLLPPSPERTRLRRRGSRDAGHDTGRQHNLGLAHLRLHFPQETAGHDRTTDRTVDQQNRMK